MRISCEYKEGKLYYDGVEINKITMEVEMWKLHRVKCFELKVPTTH